MRSVENNNRFRLLGVLLDHAFDVLPALLLFAVLIKAAARFVVVF